MIISFDLWSMDSKTYSNFDESKTVSGYELDFKIKLESGEVLTPKLRTFINKPATLTYVSKFVNENDLQVRVNVNNSNYLKDFVVIDIKLLEKLNEKWTILSEAQLNSKLNDATEMSITPRSGSDDGISIEVFPSSYKLSNSELERIMDNSCESNNGFIMAQGSCCRAKCEDGSSRTLRCCGATGATCHDCGTSCSVEGGRSWIN
ncbi:hypothetical protein CWC19_17600 [Pseudoalteromonas aurantia]|uniref:Uncharacterized protein n=2 Tax=Pseudoalteromonas aurantia TaxID=43654 RepID=A0A5S3V3B0_9GAMM|nr:hypothetical protein CWC19_17600 [Pseudoalteromonas aurantia]